MAENGLTEIPLKKFILIFKKLNNDVPYFTEYKRLHKQKRRAYKNLLIFLIYLYTNDGKFNVKF